jgi:hypothetical protein
MCVLVGIQGILRPCIAGVRSLTFIFMYEELYATIKDGGWVWKKDKIAMDDGCLPGSGCKVSILQKDLQ